MVTNPPPLPPSKIVWVSDPHLDRSPRSYTRRVFGRMARDQEVRGVVLTGDISNGDTPRFLQEVRGVLRPDQTIWFVLGNHDYYGGHLHTKEAEVLLVSRTVPGVVWLTREETPVRVSKDTCLVGTETWWDGGYTARKTGLLNDLVMWKDNLLIKDFRTSREERWEHLNTLSLVGALRAYHKVEQACQAGYRTVYLAVHVPPFEESCLTMSRTFRSHFCSAHLGTELLRVAERYPWVRIVVLAGHTHRRVEALRPLPNLEVRVAGVQSGRPQVEGFLCP